jgi:thioredoxin reductase (NADPH)
VGAAIARRAESRYHRGMKPGDRCEHLEAAATRTNGVTPDAQGCVDCLPIGGNWVHLRVCLACGHVGCCDSSPNKHATGHFKSTNHPVVRSYEPGEEWAWCYIDDAMVDGFPAHAGESATQHYSAPHRK